MNINDLLNKYHFLNTVNIKAEPIIGRERELDMLSESLLKKRYKNTVLIGEAGSGKTSIIENFAALKRNEIVLLELSLAGCLAGTRYRGDYEEKLTNVLNDIKIYNKGHTGMPIVLFIDEIHTIIAGGQDGSIAASDVVKPYLSKGEITIIGATTESEYDKTIKKDLALKRRLSPIYVGELSKEVVIQILNEFAGGKIGVNLLEYIYLKSSEILDSTNPDSSIEILDRCLARKKHTNKTLTKSMINDIVSYMR